jgi:Trypsin-like peptidase domain
MQTLPVDCPKTRSGLRFFWAMLFLVLNSLPVSYGEAKSGREVAGKTFPSVVMVVMQDSHGQPTCLGSGFFVKEDIVATNLHVVEGAASGYAKVVGKKPAYNIVGFVAIDPQRDLILLKVQGAKAPTLMLADSNNVAVGDEVYAVGNPEGLEGTFSEGIVSGIRKIGQDSLLQITAPISPGSSGGPVLNAQGAVVGVAVATFKEGQNLNFAIPSPYLTGLLGDMKPLKPLAEEKAGQRRTKSILSDLGGRSTEGVTGDMFLWGRVSYEWSYEDFSFTLHNNLQEGVRNILCLVIFRAQDNQIIDAEKIRYGPGNSSYSGPVPAKLATRIHWSADISDRQLTTKVEFRILDFEIVNANE